MNALINNQLAQKEMIEKFIINYKKDGKDKRTKTYYQKRLQNFEELWNDFIARHKEILVLKYSSKDIDAEKVEYFKRDIFSEIEEFFFSNYALIQERFENEFTPNDEKGETTGFSAQTIPNENNLSSLKLPKIQLDKFSGDYKKWPTFHDLFKTLVHENNSLSPAQKLQYLKLHLNGEAEQLLRHFQVTDCNYTAAWNLLKDRYNNKRILVNTHLKVLLSQATLSTETSEGVKGLLDTTTECLQALNNLEIETSNWDPLIVYIIVQKLPYKTHQLWEQNVCKTKELSSWKVLQEFLESRFRTLEAISYRKIPNYRDQKFQHNKTKPSFQLFHVASKICCPNCHDSHSIRQCPKFLSFDPTKRMEFVKLKGLCINCLGSGHVLVNCPSQQKCWHCKQRHHSLLHRKFNNITGNNGFTSYYKHNVQNQQPSNSNPALESSQHQILSASAECFTPETIPTTSANLNSFMIGKAPVEHVLLATALVRVVSCTGQEQIARALIDQGSQASFLTEALVQDLNLKKEPINASIHGLGKESVNHVNCKVNFTIKSLKNEFEVQIPGLVLKKLTDLLPNKTISHKNWNHFDQLDLADPKFNEPGKIDLLLGADVYCQILMEGVISRSDDNLIAQQTQLG